jgi:hypothetical protein
VVEVGVALDHLAGVNNGCGPYFPDQVCQLHHNNLSLNCLPRTSPFRFRTSPFRFLPRTSPFRFCLACLSRSDSVPGGQN